MADPINPTPGNQSANQNVPDVGPNANPAPGDQPKPKRKAPAPINRKYLDEITLIGTLLAAARDPDYSSALVDAEWDTTRVSALSDKASALEQAALAAVGRTKAREMDTEEEEDAREALLIALAPIRTGAKRKYRNVANAHAGRATYFVNESTSVSLERLLFMAGSDLLKLTPQPPSTTPEDTLSGVTDQVLTKLSDTRAAYVSSDGEQTDTELQKSKAHNAVLAAYTAAHSERIDLQLAADQLWNYHEPANAAARRAFKIPTDRPMTD